jgi:hypothetical protein
MPKATIDPTSSSKKVELKTLKGGAVTLRHLTYGEQIKKQQMAAKMTFASGNNQMQGGEFEFFQRKVAEFEFSTCIIEHNLEDAEGVLLNFANAATLDSLDPRVGEEIASHISSMNNYEEELDFLEES